MTIVERATAYAEKKMCAALDLKPDCINHTDALIPKFCGRDIEEAYEDGATEALASQWRSVEEELPEEKKVVLCFIPDMKDNYAENDAYFDMAILLEGEFINLDAETVHPTHWMPITAPSLPDTNTEKR